MNTCTSSISTSIQQCNSRRLVERTVRAHVEMVVASLFIATSFPVAASIAGSLDSILLTFFRFLLSTLMFLPYAAMQRPKELLASWRAVPRYAMITAPLVFFFVCQFEALRVTTPIKTAAIFTLGPLFSALLIYFLSGETQTRQKIIALICGMLGALWVVFSGDQTINVFHFSTGDYIFLVGTLCFALYMVLVKYTHSNEPVEIMTFWTLATGTGWLFLICREQFFQIPEMEIHSNILFAIAYLAVFSTLFTFFLTQRATTIIGPTRTAAYTYLYPGLVLLISCATGETSTIWTAAPGIILTLVSMAILQSNNQNEA